MVPHRDCSRVRLHAWGGVSARYLVNRYFCGEGTEGRCFGESPVGDWTVRILSGNLESERK